MKILIAYDGTIQAKKAVSYGLDKARRENGEVLVVQVFDPRIFIDYDAGPGARELARAEAMRMHQEGQKLLRELGDGVKTRMVFEDGDTAAVLDRHATAEQADLVLAPPKLKDLAASLSRRVLVIPGEIVVPVDNTDAAFSNLDSIIREALGMGSGVHLVGVVPVHLYSRDEKEELEQVKTNTLAAVRRLGEALRERKIAADEELRFGYPDEEILKCAETRGAALILLPGGGATPSELSKAAAIILEEQERIKRPVFLFPAQGTA